MFAHRWHKFSQILLARGMSCLTQISQISRNTRATACVYLRTAGTTRKASAFCEICAICERLKSAMKEFRVFCEIRVRKRKKRSCCTIPMHRCNTFFSPFCTKRYTKPLDCPYKSLPLRPLTYVIDRCKVLSRHTAPLSVARVAMQVSVRR